MLSVGTTAPSVSLPDQDGNVHTLDDYRGQWVVLYFYPKDDTSGCTVESCGFRDLQADYTKLNAVVIGISCDDSTSHTKFRDKFSLPFTLLADTEKKAVQNYGVWKEKSMYGRTYMGIERTTVLIDPNGYIAKIYAKVRPNGHNEEVLQDLKEMIANPC